MEYILHVSDGETYAVQKKCNAIYETGIPNITTPIVKGIFLKVLLEHQGYYERIRALLKADSIQFKILRSIVKYTVVIEPTGKEFMMAHSLTNSSSILKSLKSLEKYQVISKTVTEEAHVGYYINDALFRAWLNTLPV